MKSKRRKLSIRIHGRIKTNKPKLPSRARACLRVRQSRHACDDGPGSHCTITKTFRVLPPGETPPRKYRTKKTFAQSRGALRRIKKTNRRLINRDEQFVFRARNHFRHICFSVRIIRFVIVVYSAIFRLKHVRYCFFFVFFASSNVDHRSYESKMGELFGAWKTTAKSENVRNSLS